MSDELGERTHREKLAQVDGSVLDVLKASRHGYEAYIRRQLPGYQMFTVVHKHYHEDDWRSHKSSRKTILRELEKMDVVEVVPDEETPYYNPDQEVELNNVA